MDFAIRSSEVTAEEPVLDDEMATLGFASSLTCPLVVADITDKLFLRSPVTGKSHLQLRQRGARTLRLPSTSQTQFNTQVNRDRQHPNKSTCPAENHGAEPEMSLGGQGCG
ncbi:hypothetical protein SKAU_G00086090 [Synaphobranchus kaupii]|uniref:Uncharacterized protein n=1 Tax=Synaphobranchus kaupii TaxID=118154 RepID=A0A9Q1J600_SYNKA|nr:hypothetical protein SKAU_G00086090 [Synaphobranchus kaupii]